MDLWVREARIFKYGSAPAPTSPLCAARASRSPAAASRRGLMSFLKIGDRAAGAIKSGGTTRRAAKMVVLDLDHPDIEEFVNWKVVEEQKVAALVAGSKLLNRHLNAILEAATRGREPAERFDRPQQPATCARPSPRRGPRWCRPTTSQQRPAAGQAGLTALHIEEYDTDWNSKAYYTVSGQNSNNSVRIANAFMEAVAKDGPWHLYWRTEKEKASRGPEPKPRRRCARDLWDQIAYAAWACADPGVQFDTHDQRVAHLPGRRADQCVEPVLASTCSSTTRRATWRR